MRAPGFLAALTLAFAVGATDGTLTLLKIPPNSRNPELLGAVLFHCTAMTLAAGLALGIAQESLLRASARSPWMRSFARSIVRTPKRWFTTDPELAHKAMLVTTAAWLWLALEIATEAYLSTRLQASPLLPFAMFVGTVFALVATCGAVLLLASPLGYLTQRARRFASPGAALLAATLFASWPTLLALWRVRDGLIAAAELFRAQLGIGLALVALDVAFIMALRSDFIAARAGSRAPAVALGAACVAVTASGATLGRDQVVLSSIVLRSLVAGRLAAPLQHAIDRDGDGYGRWFGGGDCDDGNASIHPAAPEIPGKRHRRELLRR